jgi:putative cytotoxic protein
VSATGTQLGDPEILRQDADLLGAAGQAMEVATTVSDAVVGALVPSAWRGGAAAACTTAQAKLAADFRALAGVLWDTAGTLATLATKLAVAIESHTRASVDLTGLTSQLRHLTDVIDSARGNERAEIARLERRREALNEERQVLLLDMAAAQQLASAARLKAASAFEAIANRIPAVGQLGVPCQAAPARAQPSSKQSWRAVPIRWAILSRTNGPPRGWPPSQWVRTACCWQAQAWSKPAGGAGGRGRHPAGSAGTVGGGPGGSEPEDPKAKDATAGSGGSPRAMPEAGQAYNKPPSSLPAFPAAARARGKTPVQGGGGMRPRWKDPDGKIYEWDYQEGHVEVYNRRGRHQGAFDPQTGRKIKSADPERRVEP